MAQQTTSVQQQPKPAAVGAGGLPFSNAWKKDPVSFPTFGKRDRMLRPEHVRSQETITAALPS